MGSDENIEINQPPPKEQRGDDAENDEYPTGCW
jgi:hypothetical protein